MKMRKNRGGIEEKEWNTNMNNLLLTSSCIPSEVRRSGLCGSTSLSAAGRVFEGHSSLCGDNRGTPQNRLSFWQLLSIRTSYGIVDDVANAFFPSFLSARLSRSVSRYREIHYLMALLCCCYATGHCEVRSNTRVGLCAHVQRY